MKAILGLALLAALLSAAVSPAVAQLSVPRFVVASGGATRSTGGNFGIGGTIGQGETTKSTGGAYTVSAGFWFGGSGTSGINDGEDGGAPEIPGAEPFVFRVFPASPNPAGNGIALSFELPEARLVRIDVYDAAGRQVRVLANEPVAAGRSQRVWDRRDQSGARIPGGIYFLRLSAPPDQRTQKLVVLP